MADQGSGPIRRETRWLAIVIIPFLALAFVILYGFPTETRRLFAWEIKPPMSAMMLGATYLGGVLFFARAARAAAWDEIAVGFPAVGTFASILGVATIVHWDRFIHDSLAFILWAILYLTTPVLVFGTWWRQLRLAHVRYVPDGPRLPGPVRFAYALVGAVMILVSIALFVSPDTTGASWPWTLTPLTGRVMSALFALPGIVGLGVALDGRWAATRIVTEAQVLAVALILVAPLLHADGIAFDSAQAWLFFGGLAALLVLQVALYVTMERSRRTSRV